ncbi:hypothetical protein [Niabella aquatica]
MIQLYKLIPFFAAPFLFFITSCNNKTRIPSGTAPQLKARFEVAGLCANYTFSLVEGSLDTSLIEAAWTNPQTGKTYKNAFGLVTACGLPAHLKEGDTFYFEIDKNEPEQCAVCMAYYPAPTKKLHIKILEVLKQ